MAEDISGLEFVGKCYDVLAADPLNLGGSAKGTNAIDIARDGIPTYTQGGYTMPKGASLQSPFNTEVTISRSLLRNSFDFQNEFTSTLEANAGVSGFFEFSTSSSFKEISGVSESRRLVFTYVTVYVQNHVVTLELDDPAVLRLGTDFARAVAALPPRREAAAQTKAYSAFVQTFGTHFVRRVSLGGMAYSRVSSTASTIATSKEKEDSFKASASLELEAFKAGTSASEARRSVQKADQENEVDRTHLVFRGGIGNAHEIADDWFAGLGERPAPIPIGTELERLSTLLTPAFFPADAAIEAKRQALDAAIDEYIVAGGGVLEGVIRYGDRLALWYGASDHKRRAYVNPKRGMLTFHNMSAPPADGLVPATLTIVDPQGRWGSPGQEPHEVKVGSSEAPVAIRVETGTAAEPASYLTMMSEESDAFGRRYRPLGLTPDLKQPAAQWSLGLIDSQRNVIEPRTTRPLVSGDRVVAVRLDQPTRTFFRIYAQQPMPESDYPLYVRDSQYDPMFGGVENRGGSTIEIRKVKA
jgi:hypothetical protein